jgi:hypothetical protein
MDKKDLKKEKEEVILLWIKMNIIKISLVKIYREIQSFYTHIIKKCNCGEIYNSNEEDINGYLNTLGLCSIIGLATNEMITNNIIIYTDNKNTDISFYKINQEGRYNINYLREIIKDINKEGVLPDGVQIDVLKYCNYFNEERKGVSYSHQEWYDKRIECLRNIYGIYKEKVYKIIFQNSGYDKEKILKYTCESFIQNNINEFINNN